MPEQVEGSGRQASAQTLAAVNGALVSVFGPGKYVASAVYTDLYLQAGVLERVKATPNASAAVITALQALAGVARAFRAEELQSAAARKSSDTVLRAAALSYYAPRSGDFIIVPKRHWLLSTSSATTHGTLHPYDLRRRLHGGVVIALSGC